jgi:flagellar basal body rod protein FlgC
VVHVRAHNIVNPQTDGFSPIAPAFASEAPTGGVAVFVQEADGPVNLVRETIGLITASTQYEAAAALIRADEDLYNTLLDTFG